MKQFFIIAIISLSTALFGCGSKPANTNANEANTAEKVSPYANITDPSAAITEGDHQMDEDQTELAIQAYLQAIRLDPDSADAHFKLGIAYGLVEMQMEQEGNASDTVDSKGRTRSDREFEKAVDLYKKYLDANPNDDLAHYNLGRTYNKLHKDEEAAKEFKVAVKLKSEDTEYQTELGSSLIKLAQYHEAIPPLKKAIDIDPGNERAISLLEDAEAGRQRLDYVGKNTNQSNANTVKGNANVNSNMASNSNTAIPHSNSNTKPPDRERRPTPTPERPRVIH